MRFYSIKNTLYLHEATRLNLYFCHMFIGNFDFSLFFTHSYIATDSSSLLASLFLYSGIKHYLLQILLLRIDFCLFWEQFEFDMSLLRHEHNLLMPCISGSIRAYTLWDNFGQTGAQLSAVQFSSRSAFVFL